MQMPVFQEFTNVLNTLLEQGFKMPAIADSIGIEYSRLKSIRSGRTKANSEELIQLKKKFSHIIEETNRSDQEGDITTQLSDKQKIIDLQDQRIKQLEKELDESLANNNIDIQKMEKIVDLYKEQMKNEEDPKEQKIQKELMAQILKEIKELKEHMKSLDQKAGGEQ